MLRIYRCLLHLYPAGHRQQFAEEMVAVFTAIQEEAARQGIAARAIFCAREINGLVIGALQQHARRLIGISAWPELPPRRVTMHTQFRFPKTTAVLMITILAGVVWAIEKGQAIEASYSVAGSVASTAAGPSRPVESLLPGIVVGLVLFYAAGLLGWSILFALRRSGLHRLDSICSEQK